MAWARRLRQPIVTSRPYAERFRQQENWTLLFLKARALQTDQHIIQYFGKGACFQETDASGFNLRHLPLQMVHGILQAAHRALALTGTIPVRQTLLLNLAVLRLCTIISDISVIKFSCALRQT